MSFSQSGQGRPQKSLILTPEQKALRAWDRRHGEEGQVALVERVVNRAVGNLSQDLSDEGGQPSFTAALGGMLNAVAGHIALLDPQSRAKFVMSVQAELPRQVEARAALADAEGRA